MGKFHFDFFGFFLFFFENKNIHFHILEEDLKTLIYREKKLKKYFPVENQCFSTKLSGLFSKFSFFDKKRSKIEL